MLIVFQNYKLLCDFHLADKMSVFISNLVFWSPCPSLECREQTEKTLEANYREVMWMKNMLLFCYLLQQ